ncbi:Myb-like DNA-binding domain containing protein [Trichomonas vaginalis G3]|uniref:Myb-like DNA-binding domain containing protein n=1 Tax=Trichomonas vaginalis (strain ATCC PRA-98 / G3) TaxID=412133 RepID=A2EZ35_TRIV3|nr:RNA polymerase II transcription regulator recruiting protein [Trichomonas vaginalis G3]EAY02084.1 Myb-like DNA-binding domain containing protein [Trichomonas vaginalis G3]KAI5512754.1 RNA polymerase II transcription regulator recruiting protein [Trichomonas vaginalis G3]|eukprot:XP_001330839.1 Myb-like DNA-binding domain containing protein [Trichomonas vaginalis G3]
MKDETVLRKSHPREKFTHEEDNKILKLVQRYGENDWKKVASKMKGRNVRQCRERFKNYLSPNIDWSGWSEDEDKQLIEKYREMGPKWKVLSSFFPKRTEIIVKNRMNKILRKINKGKYRNTMMPEYSNPQASHQDAKSEEDYALNQLELEFRKARKSFFEVAGITRNDFDPNFEILDTPEFVY